MIVTKSRINTQTELLNILEKEMTDLKEDLIKVQAGWDVEGITDPLDIEELIIAKRNEIDIEEDKLAEMEAIYNGVEVEKPRPWEKKRVELDLFGFC